MAGAARQSLAKIASACGGNFCAFDVIGVLSYHEVAALSLSTLWLKFVRHDEEIQRFFNVNTWKIFNSYTLHEDHIDDFVDLLLAKQAPQQLADKSICAENMAWHFKYNVPAILFGLVCRTVIAFYCYRVV